MTLAWVALVWTAMVVCATPAAVEAPAAGVDASASASGRIAVTPIQSPEPLDAGLRELFEARLAAGLSRDTRVELVAGDATGASAPTHRVTLNLKVQERTYSFEIELIDVRTDEVVASSEDVCEVCGVAEAGARVEALAARLPQNVVDSMRRTTLVIRSEPPGATITIDGRSVGVAPVSAEVSPGKHRVTASKPGFETLEQEMLAEAGLKESFEVVLSASAPPPPAPIGRTLGWAALGTGVALIGGSVPLFVLEERPVQPRCVGENVNMEGLCRFRYRTLEGGVALAVVGSAALVTGVVLLIQHKRRTGGRR